MKRPMFPKMPILACDFDGTIVEDKYPKIGKPIEGAIDTLKLWQSMGGKVILWTCRTDTNYLKPALDFLKEQGFTPDAVNDHISELKAKGFNSKKVYADFYLDDHSLLNNYGADTGNSTVTLFSSMVTQYTLLKEILKKIYGDEEYYKAVSLKLYNNKTLFDEQ